MLYSVLVSIDVLIAAGLIGLVLIQQGKGANAGAAFGSGASGTVFGARGSASFLTRATAILATLFFINSLVLAYLASHRPVSESVMESATQVQQPSSVDGSEATTNIDDVKQQIQERLGEMEKPPAADDLPDDVPGFNQELMNESTEAIDNQADNLQPDVQEAADKAGQSLPEDVPQ